MTIDQSVGGTSTFGNVAFQKLTDTANASFFLDPAATGESLVLAGTATASGNLTVGNTSAIRAAFGPLSLQYKSGLDAWTTGLTLQDTNGNVGIGTTEPTEGQLVVRSSVVSKVALVADSFSGNAQSGPVAVIQGNIANTAGDPGDGNRVLLKLLDTNPLGGDNTKSSLFQAFGAVGGVSTQVFTIRKDGNVGIGTTAPAQLLHTKSVSGNNVFRMDTPTKAASVFTLYDATGDLKLTTNSTDNVLYLKDNGNVGIGTTSPSTILSVVQTSATDPIADAWTTYSSRRWKTNIIPLERSLPTVLQLQPVRFQWKADGKHDLGLIAEDVGKFLPEAVAYEANGVDAKSIDYDKIIPLLIKSIQELTVENEALKRRMAALEAR